MLDLRGVQGQGHRAGCWSGRPHQASALWRPRAPRPRRALPPPHAQPGTIVREVLSTPQRLKADGSDDRAFYAFPRLVYHVDDNFLAQVTELYRQRIPAGGRVLDLCSSWVSHLPPDVSYSRVVGHGLNAAELARNPRLNTFFVRDLNKDPTGWAFQDSSFDAVVCCVSVQYLAQPEKVMAEIYRVLAPGGVLILTFSNRMFPTKAIRAWVDADSGYARVQLVKQYIMSVEGFSMPEALTKVELPGRAPPLSSRLPEPLAGVLRLLERSSSDPFYAVIAYKPQPQHN